jgi:HAE1 family hydrophobic/amphiphilic exporter-1
MDMNIDGLDAIKLSDVADVVVTSNSDEVYAKVNGNAGIMFTMQKQTGYSTGDVSDKILARFEQLKDEYEGIDFITLMDQGVYIDLVVNSVLSNLLIGALLAVVILLIFLKDIRPTVVVAFSIPISILTAIVLMYFSNITLNVISLSGLALGVGMLVDNSIVVIENIYRLRAEGYSAKKAAVEGAKSVAGAITASTLTTICVFAPIVFTEGITRQLFVDMGLTIAYSLVASLIIALTLVPTMGSVLLKNPPKEKRQFILGTIQEAYGRLIPYILKFKPLVLLGSLALLVLSIGLATSRGTSLMPSMGSTQLTLTLTTDKEFTAKQTAEVADEAMERIMAIEGVEDVGAMTSNSTMGTLTGQSSDTTNEVSFYILTDENSKKSNDDFGEEIEECLSDLDCTTDISTSSMDLSSLTSSGITVQIKGRDLDKLQEITKEIASLVESVEGTTSVKTSIGDPTEEIRISVDKAKAIEYQLTTAQVFQAVSAKLSDASSSTKLSTDTYDYDIFVVKDTDEELTRKTLKEITITGTDSDGNSVDIPLSDLVTFETAEGLKSISRDAQSRYLTVTASIADGYNIGLVSNDVTKRLESYDMPSGYTYEMTGEDETINEAMGQVLLMLLLAVAFMYLIMVAQFQSLLSPFIIMFTIPLAFTGGFAALYLTGNEISVIAMIGFVMLAGIIVNNGIVMVDYINQLRRAGVPKKEAIKEAGMTRLRPVLMTASTTILGLSAMVFSTDMGAAMTKPMAIVMIGGLIYGTLLTLFVVPCIYDLFNRNKDITETDF